jgi:hypothetical protein
MSSPTVATVSLEALTQVTGGLGERIGTRATGRPDEIVGQHGAAKGIIQDIIRAPANAPYLPF